MVAAELVQLDGRVLTAADVFADQVELRCRNIQNVRALIGNFHIILDRAVNFDLLHADITADAVVLVDDQIAR